MNGEHDKDSDKSAAPERARLLAHDIRSAVSDVIGGVRLMDRACIAPDILPQLDRVQAAAELLARLVEELLEGAPNGTEEPAGNLNLRRFMDDELRRWHGAAEGTGISLKAGRSGNLPEIVQLPLLPLRRVVANLMSNALRHSGGDQVTLGAELELGGTLTLSVQDNGVGLPAELINAEGDLIAQPTPPKEARHGMGLHIASAHAQAMGARLRLRRMLSGGTRIVLQVPESVWSRREEPAEENDLPDLRGYRLLVADDSATNRLLVMSMLTRLGAECELARDGIEALNWLAREQFDLALIDIEMSVLGGLDVLRSERLRQAQGIAPPTSLVAMTAYTVRDNEDAILEAGADGILPKPLGSVTAFGKTIWHFLKNAPDASCWAPDFAPTLSAVTLSELMDAAGPEQQANLLDRLREDLQEVETKMVQALRDRDSGTIHAQTHVLLSLSSAIGALPTQEAARRLNRLARDGNVEAVVTAGNECLTRLAQLRSELLIAG
ncbi:Histidine kinase-, DNA gyrase B-, and HSP90-like ATPase [Jannaschia faecimaris]|uniref:histidine kinase n=1 Tax=Jannaschia faecimaris TaxID=1244108 RepID=A0A1H3RNH5_9RHOB|nr:ATP-binding protein [Jannaschia faecimaris]SDZ27304.1 Histidine kinase-, DNA gyrase B-, and HSP90-like ATPase [Jannaschia faecimaris]